MPRRTQSLLTGLALLAIGPVTAAAQNIDSPYRFLDTRQSIGPFAGYVSMEPGAIDLGPESGTILGVRYNLGISGPFVLAAELSWISGTRAVQDTVPDDSTWTKIGEADFRVVSALAGLRFNITGPRTWHGLLPYLLFGGGLTSDVAGDSEPNASLPANVQLDFGNTFTGVLGAGLEWLPSESISVRLDARNMLWKLTTPTAFLRGDQNLVLPSDQWTQNIAFSAGVSLRF